MFTEYILSVHDNNFRTSLAPIQHLGYVPFMIETQWYWEGIVFQAVYIQHSAKLYETVKGPAMLNVRVASSFCQVSSKCVQSY